MRLSYTTATAAQEGDYRLIVCAMSHRDDNAASRIRLVLQAEDNLLIVA